METQTSVITYKGLVMTFRQCWTTNFYIDVSIPSVYHCVNDVTATVKPISLNSVNELSECLSKLTMRENCKASLIVGK